MRIDPLEELKVGSAKVQALIIGNDVYENRLPKLQFSVQDCQALSVALKKATTTFPQKTIFNLHNPTHKEVYKTLFSILDKTTSRDTIFFYFSGHGMVDEMSKKLYLCLSNTQIDNLPDTSLDVQDLLEQIKSSGVGKQVVILDACHSGAFPNSQPRKGITSPCLDNSSSTRSRKLDLSITPRLQEILQRYGSENKKQTFYALLSCSAEQSSWESTDLKHGIFTHYLIRGLQGEAADENGRIDIDSLYKYARSHTEQYARNQLGIVQTPGRIAAGHQDIILGEIQTFRKINSKEIERELEWMKYKRWLQLQIETPLFNVETFSLQHVYIPLRAYYKQENFDEVESAWAEEATEPKQIVVDLESELEAWLQQADKNDSVRVISGEPGSGKSSFTKVFAAKLAQEPKLNVLHVPLCKIDPAKDLIVALGEFTTSNRLLGFNPLDKNYQEERLLIILDGLDELSTRNKTGVEITKNFVQEVQHQVNDFNFYRTHLQVLITGRKLVVQAHTDEFCKHKQVLHLLPYFLEEKDRKNYHDPENRLGEDQRQIWWQKYGQATKAGYFEMPKVLHQSKLQELTAQPLLNYLVALSYQRGNMEFSDATKLNMIYQDLLQHVYQRSWENSPHPSLKGISKSNFVHILEELALAIWHSSGRTADISAIESWFDKTNAPLFQKTSSEEGKQDVTRLLTAFYLHQNEQLTGKSTINFTHKTFGEYLVARQIVRTIKRTHDELIKHQKNPNEGWDKQTALAYWAKICGPTRMNQYLFEWICNEIYLKYQKDVDTIISLQSTFSDLISFVLKYGMPMEKLVPRLDFHEENRQAINAEEALLAILNACARSTQIMSNITWETPEMFGAWLARLQGQRTSLENTETLQYLSLLNLKNCVLDFRDFYRACLDRACLDGARLNGTRLDKANLNGASLDGAHLVGCYGLTPDQVKKAKAWQKAKYDPAFKHALELADEGKINRESED